MRSLAWADYFSAVGCRLRSGQMAYGCYGWSDPHGEALVRRVVLTLSALTATGLVLTACGGRSSPSPQAHTPAPRKVEGGQTVTQYWPLTGLKVRSNKT